MIIMVQVGGDILWQKPNITEIVIIENISNLKIFVISSVLLLIVADLT